jgi:DnaJ-class molecular chaperone
MENEAVANYWEEAVSNALEEAHITASKAQIELVADNIRVCHENYGMAFYQPENPLVGELKQAKQKLQDELDKVFCKSCGGTGRGVTYGAGRRFDSPCIKCRGNGKHKRGL